MAKLHFYAALLITLFALARATTYTTTVTTTVDDQGTSQQGSKQECQQQIQGQQLDQCRRYLSQDSKQQQQQQQRQQCCQQLENIEPMCRCAAVGQVVRQQLKRIQGKVARKFNRCCRRLRISQEIAT